jgi:excisionase family DNA binding protein
VDKHSAKNVGLLTVKETAQLLRISRSTVYRYCRRGLLPHYKKSYGLRFRAEDLEKWLEQGKRKALFLDNVLKNVLTIPPLVGIEELKGDRRKLTKKGRTCHNYGFGSIYTRETKSGILRWYICYRNAEGKRIRKVVLHASTKQEALIELKNEVLKALGKRDETEQKKEIGFSDFAQIYLEDYMKTTRRNFQSDAYRLSQLCSYFKDTDLRTITPLMIERFRKSRLKAGNTKSTTNRYLALVKRIFNVAMEENYTAENPVQKVRFYSEKDNLRERILTEAEERKLMETCSETLSPIITVALNTGMRKGEILNLQWSRIDFKARRIRIEKTKSGKVRFIPINDVLFHELNRLRKMDGQSPFLFFNSETGKPYLDMKKGFKAACRRAKIKGLRFHDLRHTFATRLVAKGVDIETIKELLGHYSITVTQRYTHSNDDRKKKAVELLSKLDRKGSNLTHH